ncbi:MAG TPA: hypothetical protein VE130_06305 [Nitrososphaeraceae archaeon]|jgi:hypothetical protein|nr:hypothetical protein [Nitrososphaeraceae archaeon]
MFSQKFFVMMLALTASVVAITVLHSQNVMATARLQPLGPMDSDANLDVAEAEEAGNATVAGTTNQTAANGNTTEFLSIQNAQSGSLSQINETAYTLELNGVANKTIMFSDRPERIVETVSTADFVGNWSAGPNSFAVDAPNDALIVENTQTGNLETAVIESSNPVYDTATNTLIYTITGENGTSIDLPSEFGQTVLVIDGTIQTNGAHPMHIHL